MLFTSFCEVEHRAKEHLNIPAKNIYESCRKEERNSGMSISLKTEWLQRTQLMTGVNRRRIRRVLRDIKYYKINTGNSVLIRGKNLKKKKKWDSNAYQNITNNTLILIHGRTITTMTEVLTYNGFLNVFSINGKTLDSPEKGVHFPDCYL